ncbi:MAG: PAS domain-containing protein [Dongiaceae bacterium]
MTRPMRRPLDLEDFAHVKDERLRRLLAHWLERRGDDLAPPRMAIDPTAIGPILANVWMCDFLPAERRFRMRLAGEEIHRFYGRNITQCFFEDIIASGLLDDVMRRYLRIVEEPAAMHCSGHIYLASERSQVGERIVLPLMDDGGAITHVIGASIFRADRFVNDGPIMRESMVETFTPMSLSPAEAAADR